MQNSRIVALAAFGATSWLLSPHAASAQALTPALCQPLTESNLAACCAAENWRDLILTDQLAFCPPLNEDDDDSGRLGTPLGTAASAPAASTGTAPAAQTGTTTGETETTATTGGGGGTEAGAGGTDAPDLTGGISENPNSGAGNDGEAGLGETGLTGAVDQDPGNSGPNNNAPENPPGQDPLQ